MTRQTAVFAVAVVISFSGCGPQGPTYESNVAPLVQSRCVSCHTTNSIAPFPLLTYADVKAQGPAMVAAVKSGLMPPWRAGPSDVSYQHDPRLTDEQQAMLDTWVKNGMPEGDKNAKKDVVPSVASSLDKVDLTLQLPQPYTPDNSSADDYRCFPIAWPQTETVYLTGFNAVPDVLSEVHHIALYAVPPSSGQLPFQWDAEDTKPGYSCFGGPFGTHPQDFPVNLLSAWIPGSSGLTFPRGLGVAVQPGSTLVLQMHYNLQQGTPAPDQTKLQFSTATSVTNIAAYQPYLDPAWVGGAMQIPPGQSNVMFQAYGDPRDFFTVLGSPLDLTKGFNVEGVMFHMHKLGTIGQLWLEKADGTRTKVVEIPKWDFHWQIQYMLDQPLRFEPGDKLRLRCTFDNTNGNREVNWGEGSDDEMCVGNIFSSQIP